MNILIAPDKFKGSLTAREVCKAIEQGLLSIDSNLNISTIPLADGGEGTCEVLTEFSQGKKIKMKVLDPLFREIESEYGISADGTCAFIEMAKASGLQLLSSEERNPLLTTTIGTGQLICNALDRGVNKIILGIGGSATIDAGMGMASALGFLFLSESKENLKPIGENMIHINSIQMDHPHSKLREVEFTVLCDVDNPLIGKQGAAFVYGPQKGGNSNSVNDLDLGLQHFASVVMSQLNINVNFPGAGAAGGLGAGAKAFLKANFSKGIDYIIQFTHLEERIKNADLIITGEGKIDEQTLSGKVVMGVAQLAARHRKPCIAFAGKNELDTIQSQALGVPEIITLANEFTNEAEAMNNAFSILKERVSTHLRHWIFSS